MGFENESQKTPIKVTEKESAEAALKTTRGLDQYKKYLQLTDGDLENKVILDLGSGPLTEFAQDIQRQFHGKTRVVSLDYSFDSSKLEFAPTTINPREPRANYLRIETSIGNEKEKMERVSGLATQLPFADESFDLVVSSAAIPLYLTSREQITAAFQEIIRVLRKGGKARLGPVWYTEVVDTDFTKNIVETHQHQSPEESERLFKEILDSFDNVVFSILPKVTRWKQSTDDIVTVHPPVLELTKE